MSGTGDGDNGTADILKLGLDATGLDAQADAVEKRLQGIGAAAERAAAMWRDFESSINKGGLGGASGALSDAAKGLDSEARAAQNAATATKDMADANARAKASADALAAAVKAQAAATAQAAQSAQAATQAQARADAAAKQAASAQAAAQLQISQAQAKAANDTAIAQAKVAQAAKDAAAAQLQAANAAKNVQAQMQAQAAAATQAAQAQAKQISGLTAQVNSLQAALAKLNGGGGGGGPGPGPNGGPISPQTLSMIQRITQAMKLNEQAAGNLMFQVNDVFTSLSNGMPGLMVLTQQGPQISQIFGGMGATFVAAGRGASAFVSALGPMRLILGAVALATGVAALAVRSKEKDLSGLRNQLRGTTADYASLAVAIKASSKELAENNPGLTRSDATQAQVSLIRAAPSGVGLDMENLIKLARDLSVTVEGDFQGAIALLVKLMRDPTGAARDLAQENERLRDGFVEYVAEITRSQGKMEGFNTAVRRLQQTFGGAYNDADAMTKALRNFTSEWDKLKGLVGEGLVLFGTKAIAQITWVVEKVGALLALMDKYGFTGEAGVGRNLLPGLTPSSGPNAPDGLDRENAIRAGAPLPSATGNYEQRLLAREAPRNPDGSVNWSGQNAAGFVGGYQFGTARLASSGLYTFAPGEDQRRNLWEGRINIPGFEGVTDVTGFRASPGAQRAAFLADTQRVDRTIDTVIQGGGRVNGEMPERDALRAIAHGFGEGAMQAFVAANGDMRVMAQNGMRIRDGNNVSIASTYNSFRGSSGSLASIPAAGGSEDMSSRPASFTLPMVGANVINWPEILDLATGKTSPFREGSGPGVQAQGLDNAIRRLREALPVATQRERDNVEGAAGEVSVLTAGIERLTAARREAIPFHERFIRDLQRENEAAGRVGEDEGTLKIRQALTNYRQERTRLGMPEATRQEEAEVASRVVANLNRQYEVAVEVQDRAAQAQERVAAAYGRGAQAGQRQEAVERGLEAARSLGVRGSQAQEAAANKLADAEERVLRARSDIASNREAEASQNSMELLETEVQLLTASAEQRERAIVAVRMRQQIEARQGDPNSDASQRSIRAAQDLVTAQKSTEQLKNSWNELAGIGEQAFNRIGEAITQAFANGSLKAVDFKNIVKATISEIVQAFLRLGVINPILNSIFGGTRGTLDGALTVASGALGGGGGGGGIGAGLLSGIGSLVGVSGVGQAAGTAYTLVKGQGGQVVQQGTGKPAAASGGLLSQAQQYSPLVTGAVGQTSLGGNLLPAFTGGQATTGYGFVDSALNYQLVSASPAAGINATGAVTNSAGYGSIAQNSIDAAGSAGATGGLANTAGGAVGSNGLSVGGALGGAAGIAGGAYSIYSGIQKGGVGGAVGVAGGVAGVAGGASVLAGGLGYTALAAFGPYGLIAAAVLALISSFLPGQKPSDRAQDATIDLTAGVDSITNTGATGAKFSQQNRDAATEVVRNVEAFSNDLGARLGGINIPGKVKVVYGDRDGLRAQVNDGDVQKFTRDEAGAKGLMEYITRTLVQSSTSLVDSDRRNIIERSGNGDNLEKLFSNLQWYDDVYKGLTRTAEAASEFNVSLAASIKPYQDAIAKSRELGLSTQALADKQAEVEKKAYDSRNLAVEDIRAGIDARGEAALGRDTYDFRMRAYDRGAENEIRTLTNQLQQLGFTPPEGRDYGEVEVLKQIQQREREAMSRAEQDRQYTNNRALASREQTAVGDFSEGTTLRLFDEQAQREREQNARSGMYAMVDLERTQAAERLKIVQDFGRQAKAEELSNRSSSLSLEERALAATESSQVTTAQRLANFDERASIEREQAILDGAKNIVRLEQVQGMERAKVIRDANESALASYRSSGKQIREYLDSLKVSSTGQRSAQERLPEAQRIFSETLAKAQANDPESLQSVTQAASNLLEVGKEMFASGQGFVAIRDSVEAALGALPAVQSYDRQQTDLLSTIAGIVPNVVNLPALVSPLYDVQQAAMNATLGVLGATQGLNDTLAASVGVQNAAVGLLSQIHGLANTSAYETLQLSLRSAGQDRGIHVKAPTSDGILVSIHDRLVFMHDTLERVRGAVERSANADEAINNKVHSGAFERA